MSKKTYISVILPLKLEWNPCYSVPSGMETAVGDRVCVTFAGREYVGVVEAVGIEPQTAPSKIREIISTDESLDRITGCELQFWKMLAEYYMCAVGEVYKAAYPAGRIAVEKVKARTAGKRQTAAEAGDIVLSDAQAAAHDAVKDGFADSKVVLLDGVTGSGKTEIYMKLALEAMNEGRSVLYMVPEIAMSRQLQERIGSVFGDRLMAYHSGETAVRRRETASAIRKSDSPYIVLGTRSSLFLPHKNLGLIIVDEEHDTSYKQDSPAPRYNGRDSAIMLAAVHGGLCGKEPGRRCNVLLGSATPSLESLYNCMGGKFRKVDLKEKYFHAEAADVEIIDTIAERRKRGMKGSLSRKLIAGISAVLERGEQVMVLRSRRSYSPAMQCPDCGFIPKCPHCNVSLSYHKAGERMLCHYCGHRADVSLTCPKCGGTMTGLGAGTQKIEEELSVLFPDASVARIDSDSMQSRAYENKVIRGFAKGEIDILIGTQILTKGFDFPGLALVAVIQADTMLGVQDFRADEKAVQLLEQFRGRCGRRGNKGLFVIQTSQPEHPVYQKLLHNVTADFNNGLLAERQAFNYPPFVRMVNVIVRDAAPDRAVKMAAELALDLKSVFQNATQPFDYGSGRYEGSTCRCIRIMLPRDKSLSANKSLLLKHIGDFELLHSYRDRIIIDVDPQ